MLLQLLNTECDLKPNIIPELVATPLQPQEEQAPLRTRSSSFMSCSWWPIDDTATTRAGVPCACATC